MGRGGGGSKVIEILLCKPQEKKQYKRNKNIQHNNARKQS